MCKLWNVNSPIKTLSEAPTKIEKIRTSVNNTFLDFAHLKSCSPSIFRILV